VQRQGAGNVGRQADVEPLADAGLHVWSRLDGDQLGITTSSTTVRQYYDFTEPQQPDRLSAERTRRQRPAACVQAAGSYLAPWGITVGANYQALSGPPIDRLSRCRCPRGSRACRWKRAAPIGQTSEPALPAGRQAVHAPRQPPGVVHREVHNVTNSHAGQAAATTSYGSLTQGFASRRRSTPRAQDDLILRPRAGDRRARVPEDRFKFDF
jgi:hypothetical protein